MRRKTLKKLLITAALLIAAPAYADNNGNGNGSFSDVSGAFGGSVSTMAMTGGMSATGSWGGYQNSSIRNTSGAGQFAGASVSWESDASDGDGFASISAESFVDGFDFSRTNAGGGFGGALSSRFGVAGAEGGFGGSFGFLDRNGRFGRDDD
jgi:hypothetical protein